ncbi:MAG: hypothetical protein R3B09_33970 [Nannocystaceae bacterium]
MVGYSGTPLPRKLGLKAGHRLLLSDAPAGFLEALGELPEGVEVLDKPRASCDVIVAFFRDEDPLARRFSSLASRLRPAGGLWIAWPKKAAKVTTTLDEGVVRRIGLAEGLVDNKVCAIDEVWSGLRFVVRVRERSKPAKG